MDLLDPDLTFFLSEHIIRLGDGRTLAEAGQFLTLCFENGSLAGFSFFKRDFNVNSWFQGTGQSIRSKTCCSHFLQ